MIDQPMCTVSLCACCKLTSLSTVDSIAFSAVSSQACVFLFYIAFIICPYDLTITLFLTVSLQNYEEEKAKHRAQRDKERLERVIRSEKEKSAAKETSSRERSRSPHEDRSVTHTHKHIVMMESVA